MKMVYRVASEERLNGGRRPVEKPRLSSATFSGKCRLGKRMSLGESEPVDLILRIRVGEWSFTSRFNRLTSIRQNSPSIITGCIDPVSRRQTYKSKKKDTDCPF